MTFKALNNIVVLDLDDKTDKVTAGGIVIPAGNTPPPTEGKVVFVGPGKRNEAGYRHNIEFEVGDMVVFDKGKAHGIFISGKEYVWINAEDAIGFYGE